MKRNTTTEYIDLVSQIYILVIVTEKKRWSGLLIDLATVIIQHPDRVRSAGFGQKDRRPVDPPPILQLSRQVSDNQWEPVV